MFSWSSHVLKLSRDIQQHPLASSSLSSSETISFICFLCFLSCFSGSAVRRGNVDAGFSPPSLLVTPSHYTNDLPLIPLQRFFIFCSFTVHARI